MAATEQLILNEMPKPLRAVTPAKLSTFDRCPRRFRYQYLDRPTPVRTGAWAHTGIGAAIHNALKELWDLPIERRTPEAARSLLSTGWPAHGFRDDRQRAYALQVATDQLAAYVEGMDLQIQPRGIERTVGAPYASLAISGRVDRVDERLDEDQRSHLVIVDYKTGRAIPTEDEARSSLQLALYTVAVRRTFRARAYRVELHHIPTGTVAGWDYTERTLDRQLRRASDTADDIENAAAKVASGIDRDTAYPAHTGTWCGFCDFRPSCREGQGAGPARDPWFALNEEPAAAVDTMS